MRAVISMTSSHPMHQLTCSVTDVSARLSEYHVHPLTCIRGLIIAHDELLLMH